MFRHRAYLVPRALLWLDADRHWRLHNSGALRMSAEERRLRACLYSAVRCWVGDFLITVFVVVGIW
jgi:hypothetical protein